MEKFKVREGIEFDIHNQSKFVFEFFTFRSPECIAEMDCFIKYAKGKKCLLDVGAYHGIFSLVFTKMNEGSHAHAFEPSWSLYEILVQNCISNGNYVEALTLALSDKYGLVLCHKEWQHMVIGKIDSEENTIEVSTETGDNYCNKYSVTPDVIKIDVEGHEVKVLKGLYETIKKYKPIIFLETHYNRIPLDGDSTQDIVDFINEFNYKVIDSFTDSEIDPEEINKEHEGERHLILIPK